VRVLQNTKIDFLKAKGKAIAISVVLILIGTADLVRKGGPRFGIDFTGGTQIIYGFSQKPDEDQLRKIIGATDLKVESIQRFDRPERNQVAVRVRQEKEGRDVSREVTDSLRKSLNPAAAADAFDLNLQGEELLLAKLQQEDPEKFATRPNADAKVEYGRIAHSIIQQRSTMGLFHSVNDAAKAPGVSPAVGEWLRQRTTAGPFTLLSAESVGPQVGKDLREKGLWAIILSWTAMLTYIALRFRSWSFGTAAVVALIHDTWVTLGFCSLLNVEISLTVVASFLTLIGYSVNDTVVIFDRIRENLPKMKRSSMEDIINLSVNQTLARTILTSALTFLVVVTLFVFGGEVLRGFSFVLLVGLIVGSYSTIFIASPVVIWWQKTFSKQAGKSGGTAPAPAPVTKGKTAKAR